MRWCIKTVQICSDSKLRHDVTWVVLRHRQQNGALSEYVVEEGVDGSLALELSNLSAITGSEVVCGGCVGELDVDQC